MTYYYNNSGKLVTSWIPIEGLTQVFLSDEQAKNSLGFDLNGNIIPRGIEQYKNQLKNEVKIKEQEKINSGIEYSGNVIDSNEKAQKFLTSLLTSVNAELISSFNDFTTKENIDINLSAQDVKNIAALLLQHVANCHKWKREKYLEIEAATTKEELEAIVLS